MSVLKSRFDWYAATIDCVDDGRVSSGLALGLGASLVRGRGRNGYAECWAVERGEDVLAHVYGRSARTGEVHVVASSEACDEVVPFLRNRWPEHRVARADSAVDFSADFVALDALAVGFAEQRGISFEYIVNSEGGATRYLGARSSEVRLRVYKKSEQLRALHPERSDIPDGIVRAELQVRPGKRDVKEATALMDADDVWGLSAWSRDFAAELLQIDAPRTSTHFRRPSDWARGLYFFGQQYAPMVSRRVELVGVGQARAELLDALGVG